MRNFGLFIICHWGRVTPKPAPPPSRPGATLDLDLRSMYSGLLRQQQIQAEIMAQRQADLKKRRAVEGSGLFGTLAGGIIGDWFGP